MSTLCEYPPRPPFYANRFVRLLTKKCVANELGPAAFTLLAVIVMTEDARGYDDPVTFYNCQLYPLIGVGSEDALDRVRKKCVQAGWLHYVPGGRRIGPGRYWVVIPERYAKADDAPTDEERDEPVFLRADAVQDAEQNTGNGSLNRIGAEKTASKVGGKPRANRGTFFPIPFPKEEPPLPPAVAGGTRAAKRRTPGQSPESVPIPPTLDTPEFREVWAKWLVHRAAKGKRLTAIGAEMSLKKASAYGPQAAIQKLEFAIVNGWQGWDFPERDARTQQTPAQEFRPPPKFDSQPPRKS